MASWAARKTFLAAAVSWAAIVTPQVADAQTQRFSVRGSLGLMQTLGGGSDFAKLDPGTMWEVEGRLKPTEMVSIGGGIRAISRQIDDDDFKVSGWFVEPRLHTGPIGGGLFSIYLAARGTFGEQRFTRSGVEQTQSTSQIEVGPGANFGLGSRVALDVTVLLGREDLGELTYATPIDLGAKWGLAIRAGLAIGIY